jgi:hypothetical protein
MDLESAPYRMLGFLIALIAVVIAAAFAWNLGVGSLARTPPIEPKLAAQPTELQKYKGGPAPKPPAEPLAATDQEASPPPAEPLAQTQQPVPAPVPSQPLAQAQNPMQGQGLQPKAYTPLTDQLFIQIAAEMATAQGGQPVLPQDTTGLAMAAVGILEKYNVDPMAYYQKALEISQGDKAEWYSQQIWARVAQLKQMQAMPQPQAPAPLPATTPRPARKGR